MQDLLLAEFLVIGAQGWKLRSGSPRACFRRSPQVTTALDILREEPCVFSFEGISREPDVCGLHLVEHVYEAFGLPSDAIPQEFDRQTGRLVLPE